MTRNRSFVLAIFACIGFSAAACSEEGEGVEVQEAKGGDNELLSKTFTGKVVDGNNVAIAGATVTVNGNTRTTSATGQYAMSVVDNPLGYHLEVQKNGFGPVSAFHLGNALSSVHTLKAGNTQVIDPTRSNRILDQASGIEVSLSANGLRLASGAAPVGTVRFTIIPLSAQTMPGDLTAVTDTGARVALETVGAVTLQAADSQGNTLGLSPNATMTVKLPVPASAGGVMPSCVLDRRCQAGMWQFDRLRSLWVLQPSTAVAFTPTTTTFTPSAVAPPIEFGLGTWNADIFKSTPACTIIKWTVDQACFPTSGSFTAQISQIPSLPGPPGPFINVTTRLVNANEVVSVLYNIWPSAPTKVTIGGTSCTKTFISTPPPTVVTATSVTFDSGAWWGGVGYPSNTVGMVTTAVSVADALTGNHPCNSTLEVILAP